MPRAFISAKVKDELRFRKLRDQIWNIVNGGKYYKKVSPHITVVPPFTVKPGHEDDVESLVQNSSLKGRDVKVNMLGVYENIHEPYVVLLCTDVQIDDVREDLLAQLPEHTEGKIIDPVRPHLTLFKTQGWWDEIDQELKESLQWEIRHRKSLPNTEIDEVVVDYKY